jgi:hypothetical protein
MDVLASAYFPDSVKPYHCKEFPRSSALQLSGPCCKTSSNHCLIAMKSLRRELSANSQAQNVTSKIFVRSTKSGKVQKIVRELYLRQDIPCSSKLCPICPANAPVDANGNGEKRDRS